jgi:hypothetical protein
MDAMLGSFNKSSQEHVLGNLDLLTNVLRAFMFKPGR